MGVREKKVELFELFYDLVFVYAISRVTLILEEPVDGAFTSCLAITSLLMFFLSILTDSPYYHKGYPHNGWDYILSAAGVGLGALVMMLLPDHGDGFIYGTFAAVLVNFTLFSIRYAKCGKPETEA